MPAYGCLGFSRALTAFGDHLVPLSVGRKICVKMEVPGAGLAGLWLGSFLPLAVLLDVLSS